MSNNQGKNRREQLAAMSPDRKANRERVYKELSSLLLERNHDVAAEDKVTVARLVIHKLIEGSNH